MDLITSELKFLPLLIAYTALDLVLKCLPRLLWPDYDRITVKG